VTSAPKISVVVPFHDNEDDLADCLDSIAAQTVEDLQVIMVDDGSTDGGAAIAKAKADEDSRFQLIQPAGGGSPGFARNRGLEVAAGEYLAFVDGDDMLPANAYELLLHTLEETGSDFASGQVFRIGPKGINPSALHAMAIKGRQQGTHITKTPRLLYDVSVWNKLFRRSFWDLHQLRYPEGMVWEDIQLMTMAHVLAERVDVISDTIYFWRERVQGGGSITQRRTDIGNLRDRMTALGAIDSFLGSYGPGKLLRAHQVKALKNDLWLYVCDMHKVSQAYRAEFGVLVTEYLNQVSPKVLRRLPATHKLAYQLVRQGAMPELAEFAGWLMEQPVKQIPLVRTGFRREADLPFRGNRDLHLPRRVFRPHWRDLDPYMQVDDVAWDGDKLVVTGRANVPSIDVAKRRNTSKIVVLRGGGRRRPVLLRARSLQNPEATALSEQERYNYDWSGYRFAVDSRRFREPGTWQAYMLVRGRSVWRPARVHTPVPGAAERPVPREVAPGLRFGARWAGLGLNLVTWKVEATVAEFGWDGDSLVIEVDAPALPARTAELVLVRGGGAATRTVPAERRAKGRFRGQIPTPSVSIAQSTPLERVDCAIDTARGDAEWDVYLKAGGRARVRVAWPEGLAESRRLAGGREVVVGRSRYGDLMMAERTPCPVIDSHSWLADGRLELRGSFLGAEGEYETILRRIGSGDAHAIPFRRDGERFVIEADVERMPFFGAGVPLRDGEWNLFVRAVGSSTLAGLKYDHDGLGSVGGERIGAGRKWYRFIVTGHDDPLITAEPRLRRTEQGNYAQRALRRGYYPLALRAPVRDAVLFVSWKGKQCGDNPLGIAAELRRRGDDREHLWVVNDWSVPVPAGGTGVLRGTREYFDALARSRWIVSNDDMQLPFRKRDGQFYLQTWHGTLLKRIGFDIENPQFISGTAYFDHLARDVAQWDLLLSPNPFSTPLMRRAFRYQGEIAEYGYPRNDVLLRPDAAAVAASVRERLGIPAGKRVVLYAPTWRDNQVYANGRRYRFDMRLDLEQAFRALGDDYVFLIRGHHQMADDVPAGMRPGFAVNVTAYPDISELYMVSEVLVTDYSSAMFDYAVTGRPMLFFTYDLAEYRDNLRGFYFDFEAQVPGPLLSTSAEVFSALTEVDATAGSYHDAYKRFAETFCSLDDGQAAARVCDRLSGLHAGGGGLAEGGLGEVGHALGERGARGEAEVARGGGGGSHDVADVAEPVVTGHHRVDAQSEGAGQGGGHLADRVRFAAGHVVAAQAGRYGGTGRLEGAQVSQGHVGDMDEVAALAAVLEHLGRRAVLQAGPEDRGHARVRSVSRHARTVHVVVPQAHRVAAGQPGPVRRQVLLGDLARGVGVARVQRRVLGHCGRGQRARAPRAAGLEQSGRQVRLIARGGLDAAVRRAVVRALAIDHHRRGQHQPADIVAAHRLQQHGGAGDVHVGVGRQVGQVHAQADDRGLMTDGVDTVKRLVHRPLVADVADHERPAEVVRPAGVHRRGQRVETTHLMARGQQGLRDVGSDEPRRTSHQNAHTWEPTTTACPDDHPGRSVTAS